MKYLKVLFAIKYNGDERNRSNVLIQASKDILCQLAGTAGFESFEEREDDIIGYVQKQLFNKDTLDKTLLQFPFENIGIKYQIQEAENKNWNQTWEEKGFEPITIKGKCIIHDTLHKTTNPDNLPEITIDTKQAFGTGSHETTYMIADELFNKNIRNKHVLDCGCGTGILSIISSKLGAATVTGYDIDEWSVENTKHNCQINNITNITVTQGDANVIKQFHRKFDIVLANINRNILFSDMPQFVFAMKENACIILSGFYESDTEMLIKRATELGLRHINKTTKNNWCMLELRKTLA